MQVPSLYIFFYKIYNAIGLEQNVSISSHTMQKKGFILVKYIALINVFLCLCFLQHYSSSIIGLDAKLFERFGNNFVVPTSLISQQAIKILSEILTS